MVNTVWKKNSKGQDRIHEFTFEFEAKLDHNTITWVHRSRKSMTKVVHDRIKGFMK